MEIGHARFFQVLADQLPLSAAAQEELRATIESKNYAALSELLDPLGDLPAAKAMAQLPRLCGGEEALSQAEEWFQAVSYTHLDVYKRQGLDVPARWSSQAGLQ